jgi:hypothetical protein
MKKILNLFVILLFFLSMQTHSLAAEEQPGIPYFGVGGAAVQDLGDGEFAVKTKGLEAEEGFVYTPSEPFTNTKINIQVTLRGEGTIILRISETDPRGRFIKEKSMDIELTEEWTTHEMPFELASASSQIDVSLITKDQAQTEFYFKDLKITGE